MSIRIALIDDDPAPVITQISSARPDVTVEAITPSSLSDVVAGTDAWLGRSSEPSAVFVDLRLQDAKIGGVAEISVPAATAIAQELRTRAARQAMASVPIVLISTQANIRADFSADSTGRDLFDRTVIKGHDLGAALDEIEHLAEGYRDIQAIEEPGRSDLRTVLRAPSDIGAVQLVTEEMRYSYLTELGVEDPDAPADTFSVAVGSIAAFVRDEIIRMPGVLVDQKRLCALLGVDEASAGRAALEEQLQAGRYTGPFCGGESRWWLRWIEGWWRELVSHGTHLRGITAGERVEILKEVLGVTELDVAQPIGALYSSRFTTICEVLEKPLDPVDGVRVTPRDPKPWQAHQYVSVKAIADRAHIGRFRVHSSDIARARQIQEAGA